MGIALGVRGNEGGGVVGGQRSPGWNETFVMAKTHGEFKLNSGINTILVNVDLG